MAAGTTALLRGRAGKVIFIRLWRVCGGEGFVSSTL
jgi:hypothetical protein